MLRLLLCQYGCAKRTLYQSYVNSDICSTIPRAQAVRVYTRQSWRLMPHSARFSMQAHPHNPYMFPWIQGLVNEDVATDVSITVDEVVLLQRTTPITRGSLRSTPASRVCILCMISSKFID